MLVQRKTTSLLPVVEGDQTESEKKKMTFFERFKRDSERSRDGGGSARAACIFLRCVMIFTGITEPYVFMNYIIPYMWGDYDPWTVYYIKVAMWFFMVNMLANWSCLILYDTSVAKTKDNPSIYFDLQSEQFPDQFSARIQNAESHFTERNGHSVHKADTVEVLSWHYCDKCDMRVPPRAHHCKICRKCILKRDHHCFMVGSCIGFKNQRYFVMMCFYITICGLLGGALTFIYVKSNVWSLLSSWTDMILPVTIVRYCMGYCQGLHCLFITQIYVELIFGALSLMYFNSQISFIYSGATPYELSKNLPIRNTNNLNKNFNSVFGDFWALNIVFPMTVVFRQRRDGTTWDELKIDRNSKEITSKHSL